jgi:hypothetical protein
MTTDRLLVPHGLPWTRRGRLGVGVADEPVAGRRRRWPPRPRRVLRNQILVWRGPQRPRPAPDRGTPDRNERQLPALRSRHLGLRRLPQVWGRALPVMWSLRMRRIGRPLQPSLLCVPARERQRAVSIRSLDGMSRLRVAGQQELQHHRSCAMPTTAHLTSASASTSCLRLGPRLAGPINGCSAGRPEVSRRCRRGVGRRECGGNPAPAGAPHERRGDGVSAARG